MKTKMKDTNTYEDAVKTLLRRKLIAINAYK
jgi:hypothetical protein